MSGRAPTVPSTASCLVQWRSLLSRIHRYEVSNGIGLSRLLCAIALHALSHRNALCVVCVLVSSHRPLIAPSSGMYFVLPGIGTAHMRIMGRIACISLRCSCIDGRSPLLRIHRCRHLPSLSPSPLLWRRLCARGMRSVYVTHWRALSSKSGSARSRARAWWRKEDGKALAEKRWWHVVSVLLYHGSFSHDRVH